MQEVQKTSQSQFQVQNQTAVQTKAQDSNIIPVQNSPITNSTLTQIQNLYPFNNPDQAALFNKMSKELRCTECQNQSIFDSMAPIALDLRREVYRQVKAGQNEADIIQFVVTRYGEDILYSPAWHLNTAFLWLGPICMLVIAFILLKKYFKS